MYLYLFFASTIFISSFLLFQVQPLLGKHILPWFGGSSAVWVTAMFFFMVALAVGYLYALWISRLKYLYQGLIHFSFILSTFFLLFSNAQVWPSAITPTVDIVSSYFTTPALTASFVLLVTIGLPFVLLSSTSSLLQFWYARLSGNEPFALYGISNIGSLLGLLSYPLIFEPFLITFRQGTFWTYGFILYGLLLGAITVLFLKLTKTKNIKDPKQIEAADLKPITPKLFLTWMFIASVPVMVLLAGTSFMTIAIAPVPFLWVGPLALYLVSFIVTFREGERLPVWTNEVLVIFTSVITLTAVLTKSADVLITILVTHVALFAISHWCHEHLYLIRPSSRQLTLFYVALSLGGIFGSLAIKVSNSSLLTLPIELMLIIVLGVVFIIYSWYKKPDFYIPLFTQRQLRQISVVVLLLVLTTSIFNIYKEQRTVVAAERNFFGYKAVHQVESPKFTFRSLQHGLTNHGFQVIEEDKLIIKPVSYYGASSGIGLAFKALREESAKPLQVMVTGLGSGGLAAYCEADDDFTFIEIDPQVIHLAKNHFSYLEYCTQHKIITGDGRLSLSKEIGGQRFDLIILDAYADDMMPVHLMTTEAIALYKTKLKEGGIIAIHISSRYLDLLGVTKALALDNGLVARHLYDEAPEDSTAVASRWVLFSDQENTFEKEALSSLEEIPEDAEAILWTDTYSALFPVVRFF
ncbi:MAG TPA: fused MFS/spermidine synthase [Candidatus Paceibacterota bacterium]|nr:fused MFS/spermidine synthase [Candidatus Paceibacterota bacterium]HMO83213.1 fused MFS/spermidine synthase [Candidatus Paceibacterota bacterium]